MKFKIALVSALSAALMVPMSARADDACTVVLCLAGNWRNISECVPPVKRVLRRLMLGGGFPVCSMSGGPGNSASYAHAGPWNCPEQYVYYLPSKDDECGRRMCRYSGVIDIRADGKHINRVWWDMSGNTVTEWLADGKKMVPDQIDNQFDADHAEWEAAAEGDFCRGR